MGEERAAYEPVTLGEIKELAEVGRPTVSNWRRRHTQEAVASARDGRRPFPERVGGSISKPLFDAEEIAEWLDHRPVPDGELKEDGTLPTYGDRFREGLRRRGLVAFKHELGSGDELITSAMAVLAMDGEGSMCEWTSLPECLRADYGDADTRVMRATRELAAALGEPGAAADAVLDLAGRLESDLAVCATPRPVVELVAALAGSVEGSGPGQRSVVSLCAGTGDLLLGLRGLEDHSELAAVELDPLRRKLLVYRLYSRIMSEVVIRSLPEELDDAYWDPNGEGEDDKIGLADVVLADPPYASGEREEDKHGPLSWGELAVRRLTDEGRAYVLVPAWALARPRGPGTGPTAQTRERLLERGHLEAVIQLPRRVHPFRTGAEHALLVLRSGNPDDAADVLLVDADRIARRVGSGWVAEASRVVREGRATRVEEARFLPVRATRPGGEQLLDGRSVLPGHRLTAGEADVDHFEATQAARRAVWAAMPELRDWLGDMGVAKRREPVGHQKLNAYLRAGQLRQLSGHRIKDADIGEAGLPVIGREEMLGALPVGQRRIALEDLAGYPNAVTTEVGDVFLLAEHGVRCRVDDAGGCVLLAPVQGLRIAAYRDHRAKLAAGEPVERDALWMRPQPLAQLLQAPRNQQRSSGSLVRRVSVGDMDLPHVSGEEVAELEAVLVETERQRTEVRRRLEALDGLGQKLAAGVADGALALRRRRPGV